MVLGTGVPRVVLVGEPDARRVERLPGAQVVAGPRPGRRSVAPPAPQQVQDPPVGTGERPPRSLGKGRLSAPGTPGRCAVSELVQLRQVRPRPLQAHHAKAQAYRSKCGALPYCAASPMLARPGVLFDAHRHRCAATCWSPPVTVSHTGPCGVFGGCDCASPGVYCTSS